YQDAIVNLRIKNVSSDSLSFTDWQILKDSSQSIGIVSVLKDSLPVDILSYTGEADSNNASLVLHTGKIVTSTLRRYKLKIATIAHISGKDSLCILNLNAVFALFSTLSVS